MRGLMLECDEFMSPNPTGYAGGLWVLMLALLVKGSAKADKDGIGHLGICEIGNRSKQ